MSRWDKAVADRAPAQLRNKLGIAVAQRTYAAYRELLDSPSWRGLFDKGAPPHRMLFASTGTKAASWNDLMSCVAAKRGRKTGSRAA